MLASGLLLANSPTLLDGVAWTLTTYQHSPDLLASASTSTWPSLVWAASLTAKLTQLAVLDAHVLWVHANSGAEDPSMAVGRPVKLWLFAWYTALDSVRALVRFDCAARSLAELVTPRKVGMAMASRMAMMSSTTISSMRVKPASAASSPSISAGLADRRRSRMDMSMGSSLMLNGYRNWYRSPGHNCERHARRPADGGRRSSRRTPQPEARRCSCWRDTPTRPPPASRGGQFAGRTGTQMAGWRRTARTRPAGGTARRRPTARPGTARRGPCRPRPAPGPGTRRDRTASRRPVPGRPRPACRRSTGSLCGRVRSS